MSWPDGPRTRTLGWELLLVAALAAVAGVATACGSDDVEPGAVASTADPATTATSTAAPSTAEPPADGTAESPADGSADEAPEDDLFPDVIEATAEQGSDGTWTISATLSSPYDSAARYADAWRVLGPDGETYGTRELAHDHAGEQPFTRSLSGVVIPDEVTEVTIEGRDQLNGWGGATVTIELPTAP